MDCIHKQIRFLPRLKDFHLWTYFGQSTCPYECNFGEHEAWLQNQISVIPKKHTKIRQDFHCRWTVRCRGPLYKQFAQTLNTFRIVKDFMLPLRNFIASKCFVTSPKLRRTKRRVYAGCICLIWLVVSQGRSVQIVHRNDFVLLSEQMTILLRDYLYLKWEWTCLHDSCWDITRQGGTKWETDGSEKPFGCTADFKRIVYGHLG